MSNKALILWFTGMSGAGKSSLAISVKNKFLQYQKKVLILDGDEIRSSRHKNLGFTSEDIKTNNSLILELCQENIQKYDIIIVPIISPFKVSRDHARHSLGSNFKEIFVRASIDTLARRDTKGLYAKQKEGLINNLIGVSKDNPYEEPENPDFIIDTDKQTLQESCEALIKFINKENQALIKRV